MDMGSPVQYYPAPTLSARDIQLESNIAKEICRYGGIYGMHFMISVAPFCNFVLAHKNRNGEAPMAIPIECEISGGGGPWYHLTT